MKPWLILIVVAAAALVAASAALPLLGDHSTGRPPQIAAPVEESKDAPALAIDGDLVYPFGVMAHLTDGKHGWTFRNRGKTPLKLYSESTTCQCTVVQLPKEPSEAKEIPPGGSMVIDMSWKPKVTGTFKQTATIGTNDPRQPKVTLSIEGKVYPAVVTVPADALAIGPVGNEEDVVRRVLVYSKDRPDLKITKVAATGNNPGQLAASVRPATPEEAQGEAATGAQVVEVTLKAGDKLGAINGELLIATDHPEKPEMKLRITGNVTGPVSFIPSRAEIRDATSSDGGSTVIRAWVRGRAETHFTVASAPAGVSVEFEPMPKQPGVAGSMHRVTVRVVPGTPVGEIRGEIVLRTDNPHAAEIRLPVEALVLGKN